MRLKGEPLRQLVLDLLARYPDVAYVLVERNQGGTTMAESVFHDLPVRLVTTHNSEAKPIRFERLLSFYRRGVVLHERKFPALEAQMLEYPNVLHDDLIDGVSIAVDHFAGVGKKSKGSLAVAVR